MRERAGKSKTPRVGLHPTINHVIDAYIITRLRDNVKRIKSITRVLLIVFIHLSYAFASCICCSSKRNDAID